jgi:hypothetical protein
MELQQLQGCALATQFLHRIVYAVSIYFGPSREKVMSHEYRRGCGRIGDQETYCLTVPRSQNGVVQKTENREIRKMKTKQE